MILLSVKYRNENQPHPKTVNFFVLFNSSNKCVH